METTGQLLIEQRERVLLLTLSDLETRNALHPGIYRVGIEALRQAEDPGIGAVVLTGAHGFFCSGCNLHQLNADRHKPTVVQYDSITLFHRWILAIRRCSRPVIAAVEGPAEGAGFSLALACDLLVAAENASFIMAYIGAGLTPVGGVTAWLSRHFPLQLAMELLLQDHRVGADRLQQLGIVNRLCPPGQALAEALNWAEILVSEPAATVARSKHLLNAAFDTHLDTQLGRERTAFLDSLYHAECAESLSAILARRPPMPDR